MRIISPGITVRTEAHGSSLYTDERHLATQRNNKWNQGTLLQIDVWSTLRNWLADPFWCPGQYSKFLLSRIDGQARNQSGINGIRKDKLSTCAGVQRWGFRWRNAPCLYGASLVFGLRNRSLAVQWCCLSWRFLDSIRSWASHGQQWFWALCLSCLEATLSVLEWRTVVLCGDARRLTKLWQSEMSFLVSLHAHAHTDTHVWHFLCIVSHTRTHTHTHTGTHKETNTHTCTHASTYTHARTHTHTYTHTHKPTSRLLLCEWLTLRDVYQRYAARENPQASYDKRRHRNCFQAWPFASISKK